MSNRMDYVAGLRPDNNVALPIAIGTVIEVGDHVKLVSGEIVLAPVAADDANLVAIAVEAKAAGVAGVNGKITVSIVDGITRYRRQISTPATLVAGDTLQISGNQTLVANVADVAAIVVEGGTNVSEAIVIYKKSPIF